MDKETLIETALPGLLNILVKYCCALYIPNKMQYAIMYKDFFPGIAYISCELVGYRGALLAAPLQLLDLCLDPLNFQPQFLLPLPALLLAVIPHLVPQLAQRLVCTLERRKI